MTLPVPASRERIVQHLQADSPNSPDTAFATCFVDNPAEHAKLNSGFAKRGILPESGGTWLLPRMVGYAKAAEIELKNNLRSRSEIIAERGYDPQMGARPMARIIQEHIKRPLAEELLFGSLEKGGHVRITVGEDGDLQLVAEPVLKELEHLSD